MLTRRLPGGEFPGAKISTSWSRTLKYAASCPFMSSMHTSSGVSFEPMVLMHRQNVLENAEYMMTELGRAFWSRAVSKSNSIGWSNQGIRSNCRRCSCGAVRNSACICLNLKAAGISFIHGLKDKESRFQNHRCHCFLIDARRSVDGNRPVVRQQERPSGCSSMVEQKPSKLTTRVRFPSPAPSKIVCNTSGLPQVAVRRPQCLIEVRLTANG